eukprot:SAG31_NODE_1377_length_8589_cov_2.896584_6_plen_89_part_00
MVKKNGYFEAQQRKSAKNRELHQKESAKQMKEMKEKLTMLDAMHQFRLAMDVLGLRVGALGAERVPTGEAMAAARRRLSLGTPLYYKL